jgi:hypothetical protein
MDGQGDKLTIFGRKMRRSSEQGMVLSASVGLFDFEIVDCAEHGFCGCILLKPGKLISEKRNCSTKEAARDWLESEARRICREMVEMAGELVTDGAIPFFGGTQENQVRFKDP